MDMIIINKIVFVFLFVCLFGFLARSGLNDRHHSQPPGANGQVSTQQAPPGRPQRDDRLSQEVPQPLARLGLQALRVGAGETRSHPQGVSVRVPLDHAEGVARQTDQSALRRHPGQPTEGVPRTVAGPADWFPGAEVDESAVHPQGAAGLRCCRNGERRADCGGQRQTGTDPGKAAKATGRGGSQ